ncbi:MAG: hypothetical protein M2R45_04705 [Verrucomicrobia subdivision 3 bacterium]|nr:hypothetical protein [Limisphaerales bacterium]MCS1416272.1 hypothetical protein [Limisphaerales bacterium]
MPRENFLNERQFKISFYSIAFIVKTNDRTNQPFSFFSLIDVLKALPCRSLSSCSYFSFCI